MVDIERASAARRRLREVAAKHGTLLESLVAERGPLLRGTFQFRRTRCGKEGCKCAQGELHTAAALVVSEGGERRTIYLRTTERPEAQRRAERYRRFRKTRSELKRMDAQIAQALDELLAALIEPPVSERDDEKRRGDHRKQR